MKVIIVHLFFKIKSSTDLKKKYFYFSNTYNLLGFTKGSLSFLNNNDKVSFTSDKNEKQKIC